jgi:putative membrane protein insertion efficiency factor
MVQINKIIRKVICVPLYGYQWLGKKFFPNRCCRFYPSCSSYAIQAIMQRGVISGLGLTFWRLLRCGPWSLGGYDPVGFKKHNLKEENT